MNAKNHAAKVQARRESAEAQRALRYMIRCRDVVRTCAMECRAMTLAEREELAGLAAHGGDRAQADWAEVIADPAHWLFSGTGIPSD